jgi:Zn-dependent protease with chaperone function
VQWLVSGLRQSRWPSLIGVVLGWTGAWLALWGAIIGLIVGVLVGFGLFASNSISTHLFNLGLGQSSSAVSAIVGGLIGIPLGFLAVINFLFLDHPLQAVLEVISGALVSVVIVVIAACFERANLRLRGYRRLSQDEVRQLAPLVKDVAEAMDLPALPRFAIDDTVIPNAYAHMRTVVVTKGLLQTLNDGEIRAILAHELQHWQAGDPVAMEFVWAASLPAVLLYKAGIWMTRGRVAVGFSKGQLVQRLAAMVGWFVAWPAFILIRWFLIPVLRVSNRRWEYQADQAAASIGLGPELISALQKLSAFESDRTGWEYALSATHPPTELRVEALQQARPDDWEYQEEELNGPSWAEIRRIFGGLRGVVQR